MLNVLLSIKLSYWITVFITVNISFLKELAVTRMEFVLTIYPGRPFTTYFPRELGACSKVQGNEK